MVHFGYADQLDDLLALRGPPRDELDCRAYIVERESWGDETNACSQRHLSRGLLAGTEFATLVAGRQSGKSDQGAFELVQIMCERPGSFSALLAPTLVIARAAIRKVLELVKGRKGWVWKEQKKELHAPNGSIWGVFSGDRKETVRGPTLTGMLWVDEGAFLYQAAWEAALGALAAARAKILITTSPSGKGWVYEQACSTSEGDEFYRFRTIDSPFANKKLVAKIRTKMSAEKAAQEFDAEFVDSLLLAFSDRSRLFVQSFPDHSGAPRNVLGVDLGKEQDYVVVTLMNQWGEAIPLGRWRRTDWPTTLDRIEEFSREHSALCVLDTATSSGYGNVLKDFLEQRGIEVLGVNTGVIGTKGRIVEQAKADVQWGKVTILVNQHFEQFEHELARFQGIKRQIQGREVMVYEGPQVEGEHDDCVISFVLANWGRVHGFAKRQRIFDLGGVAPVSVLPSGRFLSIACSRPTPHLLTGVVEGSRLVVTRCVSASDSKALPDPEGALLVDREDTKAISEWRERGKVLALRKEFPEAAELTRSAIISGKLVFSDSAAEVLDQLLRYAYADQERNRPAARWHWGWTVCLLVAGAHAMRRRGATRARLN